MTEFKVGDRVHVVKGEYTGEEATLLPHWDYHAPWFGIGGGRGVHATELTHATPVPIGYTGKLRDMDLKEGDVVSSNATHWEHVTLRSPVKTGLFSDGGWFTEEDGILTNDDEITLISRANTANSPAWSKWRMSKEDGTIQETWDEIETHPIPDMAHQVLYRGRNTPAVTHEFEVDGVVYTVDVKGGVPNWGSVATA